MTMMKYLAAFALALALLPNRLAAQDDLDSACRQAHVQAVGVDDECFIAVQALLSGQPALGLVLAGGNPTLGSSGGPSLSFGLLPSTSAGVRINTVMLRVPDILAEGGNGDILARIGVPVPAISADASIAVVRGASVGPGVAGIGSVDLIGSIGFLPLSLLGVDGFDQDGISFGVGGRVHLVNESFVVPGLSLSAMYRQLGRVNFGSVCSIALTNVAIPGTSETSAGACTGPGDRGEFSSSLNNWSGRAVVAKHLLGFGLSGGLGYDRFNSDVTYGFRAAEPISGTDATLTYRVTNGTLETTKWTVFGGASFTLLLLTMGVEAGWQQGSSPISGFEALGSEFDPKGGIWFGSVGGRLAL